MLSTEKNSLFTIGSIVSLIMTIIVNFLAIALPLNGKTTQELSDGYPNPFTPAGYVFSIWSIIYTLLIVFVLYQTVNREKVFDSTLSGLFIISNIFNSVWIFLWHYEQIFLSLVVMIGLLLTLIGIYWRLKIGLVEVDSRTKWAVHVPFSVYLGWISVATIANTTVFLLSINWDGFGVGAEIWTGIVLFVATILAMILVMTRNDVAYGLVAIWAFIGIIVKQFTTSTIVAGTAGLFTLIILLTIVGKNFSNFYNSRT
ncbi:MAG: TspO/MBR family protein [Candidatus Heimdallarchaeota archaeon]